MRTYSPKPADIQRAWHVVDVDGLILGRVASEIAQLLRGKHKPIWAPHLDTGDHVVVVNAAKVRLSGEKTAKKEYWRHSGFPGGIKRTSFEDMLARHPERVLRLAIRGMLPKGPLGRKMLKKLHVYAGPEHPHAAQQPRPHTLKYARRPADVERA